MKLPPKKLGALSILVTIAIGLTKYSFAVVGDIHSRLNGLEKRVEVLDDDRLVNVKPLLTEIRNDIKKLLSERGR